MSGLERARVAPLVEVVAIFQAFAGLSWPVPEGSIPKLVDKLGWRLVSEPGAKYPEADTQLGVSDPMADFSSDHAELTKVSFVVTDVVPDDIPWRLDFMNDAFVQVSRAVSPALGPPAEQAKGQKNLYAHWDLTNGGLISLRAVSSSVGVDVASTRWAEIDRSARQ